MKEALFTKDIPVDGVIPVWQPIGWSTNEIARQVGMKHGVKTSHTGTLDPMAEGVIIVLSGETRNKKYEYANWPKEYEFEVIFGISTDTYDGMGLVEKNEITSFCAKFFKNFATVNKFTKTELENFAKNLDQKLASFVGLYEQIVPSYSSVKFMGKPLHYHVRGLSNIETKQKMQSNLPKKEGQIFSLKNTKIYTIKLNEAKKFLLKKIKKVEGDFRQVEIMDFWKSFMKEDDKEFALVVGQFHTVMTKGLYVRSLALDIAKSLGTVGFVSNLIRIRNGDYTKKDCFSLENILNL